MGKVDYKKIQDTIDFESCKERKAALEQIKKTLKLIDRLDTKYENMTKQKPPAWQVGKIKWKEWSPIVKSCYTYNQKI